MTHIHIHLPAKTNDARPWVDIYEKSTRKIVASTNTAGTTAEAAENYIRKYPNMKGRVEAKWRTSPAKTVDRKVRDDSQLSALVKHLKSLGWDFRKASQEIKKKLPSSSYEEVVNLWKSTKDTSFPQYVTFNGEKYSKTGKTGKNFASGEETAEYRLESYGMGKTKIDKRVWRTASGKITRDSKDTKDA